jgi:alpha-tubulin suppressor-like RCC1 family protein
MKQKIKKIFLFFLGFFILLIVPSEIQAKSTISEKDIQMVNSQFAGAFIHSNGKITMAGSSEVFGIGKQKKNVFYTKNGENGNDWIDLSANDNSFYGIKKGGTMWSWGFNDVGQLGDASAKTRYKPVQIGKGVKWKSVSSNYAHGVALSSEGYIYAWGANWSGQLGNGTTHNSSKPIKIGTGKDWVEIIAGGYHTVAFKKDGSMWAWGAGSAGRLGNGSEKDVLTPTKIANNMKHKSIAVGSIHTLMVKKDGSLWAWGGNQNGQIGIGSTKNVKEPMRIGKDNDWKSVYASEEKSFAIKSDGTLWAWGLVGSLLDMENDCVVEPRQVGRDSDWVSVSNGSSSCGFTYFLKSNGTVYGWGNNGNDQLLLGSKETGFETNLVLVNYDVRKKKVTIN